MKKMERVGITLVLGLVIANPAMAQLRQAVQQQVQQATQRQAGEKKDSQFTDIEERAKAMSEAIMRASTAFDRAANSTPQERIKRLDVVIATIDQGLAEIGAGGKLTANIDKAIADTEGKVREYKEKAGDPKLQGRTRATYDRLARRFETQVNSMYDKKMLLNREADSLNKKKLELNEQKGLVADLMLADELELANEALMDVITSVQGVSRSIDEFARQMTAEDDTPAGPAR